MVQVTVPSVSANNLQISLPVHSLAYTLLFVYYCMEATDLSVILIQISNEQIIRETQAVCFDFLAYENIKKKNWSQESFVNFAFNFKQIKANGFRICLILEAKFEDDLLTTFCQFKET